jgi:hypothetical protein
MLRRLITIASLALVVAAAAHAQSLDEDLIAAARKGNAEAVKDLLAKGANVNAKSRYGATALSYAADRGNAEIVKLLLERGAEVDVQDTFYRATPMTWASMKGNAEIVKLLLDKGAGGKEQALMMGAENGHKDMVKVVLDKGGVTPETLTAALKRAERNKHAEVAEMLKAAGAKAAPAPDFQVDAATLQSYAGVYKHEQIGELTFTFKDGKLTGQVTGQGVFTMGAYDKTSFTIIEVDDANIKFNLEGDKVIGFTLKQRGATFEFKKLEQK